MDVLIWVTHAHKPYMVMMSLTQHVTWSDVMNHLALMVDFLQRRTLICAAHVSEPGRAVMPHCLCEFLLDKSCMVSVSGITASSSLNWFSSKGNRP